MTQNRQPPAYQEYAASMLANNNFRMMSLEARGLWYTLRLEHWVENPLPADPVKLAKILRLDIDLVTSALQEHGDLIVISGGIIHIPELDDYREHLADIRKRQSSGGKEGAEIARQNAKKRNRIEQPKTTPEDYPKVTHASTLRFSVKNNSKQPNSEQPNSVINKEDEWITDYESSSVHGD